MLDLLLHHYQLIAYADGLPGVTDTVAGYNIVLLELLNAQRQCLMQLRQHNIIRQLENELDLKEELAALTLPKE